MHPARHRETLGPAPAWTVVWLLGFAMPVLAAPLVLGGADELRLLDLSAPELPDVDLTSRAPIAPVIDDPIDSRRDPFTAPMSRSPICGVTRTERARTEGTGGPGHERAGRDPFEPATTSADDGAE